ncbi:MAG: hypothetical protein RSA65_09945, partial [Clostridia bacterium]
MQNILDAMDDANRRAKRARTYSERCVYLQEAAQYAKIFKAFMNNLTRKQEAEQKNKENKAVLSALGEHLISNGLMTQEQINRVCEKGMHRVRSKEVEYQKELERIYGELETICNRGISSPTEREAFKH